MSLWALHHERTRDDNDDHAVLNTNALEAGWLLKTASKPSSVSSDKRVVSPLTPLVILALLRLAEPMAITQVSSFTVLSSSMIAFGLTMWTSTVNFKSRSSRMLTRYGSSYRHRVMNNHEYAT